MNPNSPRHSWVFWILCALATLALTVYFYVPLSAVHEATLDSSNYASYAAFTAAGKHFGTDVVPMAGPYGFVMYGWTYSGHLVTTRVILELLTKVVCAALTVWFFCASRGQPLRWVWLVASLTMLPITPELTYDFSVLYATLYLLLARPRWPLLAGTVVFLAFLALCKGTQLFFTAAVLAVVGLAAVRRKAWLEVVVIGGGYVLALPLLWVLIGQRLADLPAYLHNIRELASGYHTAMAVLEPAPVFIAGLGSVLGLLAGIGWLAWSHRRESVALACAALLAGFTFLQWKHGFVRADGHVYLFFNYAVVGSLIAPLLDRASGLPVLNARPRLILALITLPFALYAAGGAWLARNGHYLRAIPHHFASHFGQLVHPQATREHFDLLLENSRARFALPEVVRRVGRSSIDFFGFNLGYLPLNGLNFQPRPVGGGSFNVFTSRLAALNARHVRDPASRPDYFLLNLQTIDQRLVTQDDSPSLNLILNSYRPVLGERGHLLYQASSPVSFSPTVISKRTLPLDQFENVPVVAANEMVLASVEVAPSFLGALRGAVYKPAILELELTLADTSVIRRRIVSSMARDPFLLSPFVDATPDLLALYAADSGRMVKRIKVLSYPPFASNANATVSFYRQLRPDPLSIEAAQSLRDQLTYPFANRAPLKITSPNASLAWFDGREVQELEPEGAIAFALHGNERELLFDYGILPEAYERGTTDGVEIIVELRSQSAAPEILWRRSCSPRTVATERGRQKGRVLLPFISAGDQILIRTSPGPSGESAWDWAWLDSMRFISGPYRLDQFPGFSLAPVEMGGTTPRVMSHEDHDVLLLNSPGYLVFALTGREHHLRFSGGLIPGAYTRGETDGVAFIVEMEIPGSSSQKIFARYLQPRAKPEDRGTLTFDVSLPENRAGSRLTLRADPGPSGNGAWDWSYVTNVRFE